MSTTTRPRREATIERCPCCSGRGVQFAECAGGRGIPHEMRCDCCRGGVVVDAFPEPATFDADPDVDGVVTAFWDAPPDAEDERVRRACRDRWGAHVAAYRVW